MTHPEQMNDTMPRTLALLERDEPLAALSFSLERARTSGTLAVISGEAGIGKTALLEAFAQRERDKADFFRGACDALKTPSPLAPLVDIATRLGGQTARQLAAGATPHVLFA